MTRAKALLILVSFLALVSARETTYGSSTFNAAVTGGIEAPSAGVVNPLYLRLEVSGDVTGTLETEIQFNNTQQIAGGKWTFSAAGFGPDGSAAAVGTLTGSFAPGGSGELNADGSMAAVKGAALVIESGTGTYEAVASGSGTLDGTFGGSPTPVFSGTLTFTF